MNEKELINYLKTMEKFLVLQNKHNKTKDKQLKLLDQQIEMIFFDVSKLSQRIRNLER